MNEMNIKRFLELSQEYIRTYKNSLDKCGMDKATQRYEDLSSEASRQQLFDYLYH